MKLPSGVEIPRKEMEELCETVIREEFYGECTFAEAFEPTAENLAAGEVEGIPALDHDDIQFVREALRKIVFQCVEMLTTHLVDYFRIYVKMLNW